MSEASLLCIPAPSRNHAVIHPSKDPRVERRKWNRQWPSPHDVTEQKVGSVVNAVCLSRVHETVGVKRSTISRWCGSGSWAIAVESHKNFV